MAKRWRFWLAGLWGVLASLALAAPSESLQAPQRVIQEAAAQLRGVLDREAGRVRDNPAYVYQLADQVLIPYVHMEQLAALVLSRHWRQASPAQREAFAQELQRLLVRTYATALRELGNWEIQFLPLRLDEGQTDTLVQTRVNRAGAPPLAMDYRMCLQGGRWQAYDVSIEGVSLLHNYRTGFAQTIERKGLDGLIAELAARNAERLGPQRSVN